jgi:hypothetical protein
MVETIGDVMLAALLLLSIVWSALLHRRLTRLRADRSELEGFIGALAGATDRAEAAIGGLRSAGSTVTRDLQAQEESTRRSIDQLTRALEAAARTVRRLEQLQQAPASRPVERGDRPSPTQPLGKRDRPAEPAAAGAESSRIPADVMRVLQGLR